MPNVPQLGTYTPEDNSFNIQINGADAVNGQIDGVYETNFSPEGPFKVEGQIGIYSWISQESGDEAPFSIRFIASVRPTSWPYSIEDTWTGAYQLDNTLLMEGARSYVNGKGVVQVTSLGTMTFSQ